ncbi:hypothetical protein B0H10DRAFT_1968150 [Mycena sp. CBHHK59/15]|nr:hypothetical protein B0H10DRAFT_1968150 [Mycena sp. CBHHK59/15]
MVDAAARAAHNASTTTLRGEDQMNNALWTEPQLAQHRGSKPNDDAPASIRCREYTIPPKPESVPVLLAFLVLLAAPREVFRVPVFCLKLVVVVWVEAQLDVNAAGTITFVRGAPQRQQSARLVDAIANPAAEGVGRSDCRPREVVVRRQEVFGVIVSAPYALAWAPVCYSQCLAPVAPGDAVRLCFGAGGGLGSRQAVAGWAPASCKGGAGLSVCGRAGMNTSGTLRVGASLCAQLPCVSFSARARTGWDERGSRVGCAGAGRGAGCPGRASKAHAAGTNANLHSVTTSVSSVCMERDLETTYQKYKVDAGHRPRESRAAPIRVDSTG